LFARESHTAAVFPRHAALEGVAEKRRAVFESETGQRRFIHFSDLYTHTAGGGSGKVEGEFPSLETEGFGDEFAAAHGSLSGDKAVETQCVAAKCTAMARPVAFSGVKG
jgi:hypothetical protein